jgi:hypothetical protein
MNALSPPWHVLLGPLPVDGVPTRKPVTPPELRDSPNAWAVAGWEQLVLHLSAGAAGSRTIMVVLDARGTLLSASDGVLYCTGLSGGPPPTDCEAPTLVRVENIGGRFEPDGSFNGTRWHSVTVDRGGDEEPEWESTPSQPSAEDVSGLRFVVAELMRRQPPQS